MYQLVNVNCQHIQRVNKKKIDTPMPGTYVKSAIIFSIKDADEMKRNVSLQGHFSQFHVVILFLGGTSVAFLYRNQ